MVFFNNVMQNVNQAILRQNIRWTLLRVVIWGYHNIKYSIMLLFCSIRIKQTSVLNYACDKCSVLISKLKPIFLSSTMFRSSETSELSRIYGMIFCSSCRCFHLLSSQSVSPQPFRQCRRVESLMLGNLDSQIQQLCKLAGEENTALFVADLHFSDSYEIGKVADNTGDFL